MKGKKSAGKRLSSTVLIGLIVLSVFTAGIGIGILPVGVTAQVATVQRYLPDYVEANETFIVGLTQSGFLLNSGTVREVLPEGFEYVNGSYTGGSPEKVTYNTTTRTLMLPFRVEYSIEYRVKASPYEQHAQFSGTYRAFVKPEEEVVEEEGAVTGNTKVIVKDETLPASITNLQHTNGAIWITWTWTNPPDADFSHVMVYLNGLWWANTSYEFYNARGLNPDMEYEIGTRTVDKAGNINATWVNGTARTMDLFDTGSSADTYPSISGTHTGTIKLNKTINVSSLYTYSYHGTGGHTEYARIWNDTGVLNATATWEGYVGNWHNIVFNSPFTLIANETYNYTIRTGSYPQIHHDKTLTVPDGEIACTKFTDINGRVYYNWIPAFKLYF